MDKGFSDILQLRMPQPPEIKLTMDVEIGAALRSPVLTALVSATDNVRDDNAWNKWKSQS